MAIALVAVCATGTAMALAADDTADTNGVQNRQGMPDDMEKPEDMVAIDDAIDSGNYSAWFEAITSRPKVTDYINEDNFDRYVEMRKLMEEGNVDEANAIRDELGLPEGLFGPHGGPGGRHGGPDGAMGDQNRDSSCNTDTDTSGSDTDAS